MDGAHSVEGASEAEVEDGESTQGGTLASLDYVCFTDVFENGARVMRSVPFVMRDAFRLI